MVVHESHAFGEVMNSSTDQVWSADNFVVLSESYKHGAYKSYVKSIIKVHNKHEMYSSHIRK